MNRIRYSISDLEKLTGIKAHTIRIWEKRYHIISPERTETNIRYYSVNDLQRLMNISFLNRNGYKISQISEMSDSQVQSEVARICEKPGTEEGYLTELLKATQELDEEKFERIINGAILKLGFDAMFRQVVFPLLEKINLLWQIGKISSCQERFAHNLIRHKLVVAIDGMVGSSQSTNQHYLLYLPSGQYDEIVLLYTNYLLRKSGHQVIYLGPSIPLDHLRFLTNRHIIDNIVVSINNGYSGKELDTYASNLTAIFPKKKIYIILQGFDIHHQFSPDIVRIDSYLDISQRILD